MPHLGRKSAPKRLANVRIRGDLLVAARSAGVDLSATLERALVEQLSMKWREDNREAIAAYNEHVERHGVFPDGVRRW
jgi:antitoxin CcdA